MGVSRIAFVSSMYGETWGGSEQLWGAAAQVLLGAGHRIAAGVNAWPGPHKEWDALQAAGCELHLREYLPRRPARLLNRLLPTAWKIPPPNTHHRWLRTFRPDLVVVCQAWTDDGLEFLESCRRNRWRYASIVQAASEYQWPDDTRVARLRQVYQDAEAAFFVSRHNRQLTELQIAAAIPQGEVVWNPFGVNYHQPLPWPQDGQTIKLACVGRLQPDAKGQDILLRVLSQTHWQQSPIEVTLFGKGVNRHSLEELAGLLGVRNLRFGGFVSEVAAIWRDHHALILPSRKEGMPIVLIEAALCGRPAICSRVAGVPEVVEDGITGFLSAAPEVDLFGAALERAWRHRDAWPEMGLKAAARVRSLVPEKPAERFAERLVELAQASSQPSSPRRIQ